MREGKSRRKVQPQDCLIGKAAGLASGLSTTVDVDTWLLAIPSNAATAILALASRTLRNTFACCSQGPGLSGRHRTSVGVMEVRQR